MNTVKVQRVRITPDRDALASTKEVAAFLGLKPQAIHDMRRKEVAPPAYRVGRDLKFKWSEVDEWLERHAA